MYRSLVTTLFLCLLVVPFAGSGRADDQIDINAEDLNPSEVHQILGRQKAEALSRARQLTAMAEAESAEAQTDYDMKWYDITIRVNDTTEILYGKVTFLGESLVDALGYVEIDFSAGMTVDSIKGLSGHLVYSRSLDRVTVFLDGPYDAGEQFRFDFYYHGHPVEGGLQAFTFGYHLGKRSISSLSEPYFARTWWPCKDRMDDKPDSIGIHIEVDTALYCASNGTLDSIVTVPLSNSHTFHYTHRYPIATYLFSVAIARFVVWEQDYSYDGGAGHMPLIHHVYTDWDSYSRSTWGQSPAIMAAFEGVFGPYPYRTEKYGHANFDWGGGMEHQTVTSMVGSTFGFSTSVVAHEMSHQWWGDLVTCKSWHDIWLNEGWASYAEAVYELERSGWPSYHTYMNYMAYKGSGTVWCDDTANVYRIFSGNLSYDKGAWVVHMLRGVVGEDGFAAGIQAYRDAYAYSAATTEDFKLVWEAATGVDLDAFLGQWVFGQYYPKYSFYYESEPSDTGGYDIYLLVKQTQTTYPNVFEMPVDFFFDYTSMPDDTLTLTVDDRVELFRFNETSPITSILLDPAGWILKDVTHLTDALFIITSPEEIRNGTETEYYEDTVKIIGSVDPDAVMIVSGALPPGLTINLQGVISGTPTTAGQYSFDVGIVNYSKGISDQVAFGIEIGATSCCVGKVGDANNSGDDNATIGDITAIIDMLFVSFEDVDCLAEADVNQSGGPNPVRADVTIGDITKLIDHLFINEQPLPDCF
jgi:hypothetical protein